MRADQQAASTAISTPLVKLIRDQGGDLSQARQIQVVRKQTVTRMQAKQLKMTTENVISGLKPLEQHCALAAQEKGTSSWLVALPIQRHGFALDKGSFWDAIAMRYGWHFWMTPSKC